jgi:hypothetical protein
MALGKRRIGQTTKHTVVGGAGNLLFLDRGKKSGLL